MTSIETCSAKIIVIGTVGTGKTALIERISENKFSGKYQSTIGVDFKPKAVVIDDCLMTLRFWDIAGQERMAEMCGSYYRDANAAIVVFDLTKKDTLDPAAIRRLDSIRKVHRLTLPDGTPIPVILLANKCDCVTQEKPTQEEIDMLTKEYQLLSYFETSALTGSGVEDAIGLLTRTILQNMKTAPPSQSSSHTIVKVSSATTVQPMPDSCTC